MKLNLEDREQRDFNIAIVEEEDSIFIDEARTPLIISGAAEDSSERYISVNKIIPQLTTADYEKDEKARTVTLTEAGMTHVEQLLKEVGLIQEGGLYDIGNVLIQRNIGRGRRAEFFPQFIKPCGTVPVKVQKIELPVGIRPIRVPLHTVYPKKIAIFQGEFLPIISEQSSAG